MTDSQIEQLRPFPSRERHAIKIGDTEYPLRVLTLTETLEYISEVAVIDELRNPEAAAAFVPRFAEVSGIPLQALETLSYTALLAVIRFFSEALVCWHEKHNRMMSN